MNPLLSFTKSNMFSQNHHYDIAQEDTIRAHRVRVERGLKIKKTFLGMVFSEYKLKLLEYSLAAIVSCVLILYSGKVMISVSDILKKEKLDDIKVIQQLGVLLGLNILCTSSGQFLT